MDNLFDVTHKVVVVTGAGGVLAAAISERLAASGATMALLTRKPEEIKPLVEGIVSTGGKAKAFKTDILSKDSLMEVRREVLQWAGKVDVLLNIAGGNLPGATIKEDQRIFDISMEDFDRVMRLNLNGTILPSLVFGELMADQKQGNIINYSSMAADRVLTRVAGYSASKAAMENFTKWMAVDMAIKFGGAIRVNAIAPGFFVGNQNRSLLMNEDGSYTDRGTKIINNTPMGRFGNAEELNGTVQFLCSDASKFITGAVIPVDGGFNAYSGV
ncbi:MAG: SDR family oxidoreductase [Sediminicola sp.]|tara:strand:+ start:13383 stop:14198 length:816 start_codon:yes stop_codon:yes gene_type:complete